MAKVALNPSIDFSLVQGGPLFQLLRWSHLLQPPTGFLGRRIFVITMFAWLPLLVLSAVQGNLIAGIAVPFLLDISAHVRFLVCIPLLVAAEVLVHARIRMIVRQFVERGIVAPADEPRFDACVAAAMRLRNSIPAELLILALSITAGLVVDDRFVYMHTSSWFLTQVDSQAAPTIAGYWYLYVSLAVLRFLLFRWYFRILIWYIFLFRVARTVPLQLNPLHPDHAAGLGFLTESSHAFQPLLIAHTAAISGIIAGRIFFESARLVDFKVEIAIWMIFLLLLVLAPLLFFTHLLARAKRAGNHQYGIVASHYVADFWTKWIKNHPNTNQHLLGTADIQSLADLSDSYAVTRDMRLVPFEWAVVVRITVLTAIPLLPLLLTIISLEELILRGLKVLL